MDTSFLLTKEYIDSLNREQLTLLAESRSHLGYLRQMATQDKEHAFLLFHHDQKECTQRHYSRIGVDKVISLEEAFDLNNPHCIKHSSYDGHSKYLESLEGEALRLESLDWHHIQPEPMPKWTKDVEAIESALARSL